MVPAQLRSMSFHSLFTLRGRAPGQIISCLWNTDNTDSCLCMHTPLSLVILCSVFIVIYSVYWDWNKIQYGVTIDLFIFLMYVPGFAVNESTLHAVPKIFPPKTIFAVAKTNLIRGLLPWNLEKDHQTEIAVVFQVFYSWMLQKICSSVWAVVRKCSVDNSCGTMN